MKTTLRYCLMILSWSIFLFPKL